MDRRLSIKNVRKWCREFSNGRTNIHDEARSGRPSVSDNLQEQVESELREDRRVTVRELEEKLEIPKPSLHRIISDFEYRKCSARWVPKMLTEDHKRQRIESSREVLELYAEVAVFLDSIVTGDETKGVLLIEFMPTGTTINSASYCKTLEKLRKAIKNRRPGMLTKGVRLLRDNARPHVARNTKALLDKGTISMTRQLSAVVESINIFFIKKFKMSCQRELLSYLLLEEIEEEEFLIEQLLVEQSNANEHPLFTSRPEGFFEILVNRHLIHDDKKFREFFRLNIDQFNYILQLIEKDITVDSSNRHPYPITALSLIV
ncbi:hypothetical protein QTP88_027681 [Uroleucon formosanum]